MSEYTYHKSTAIHIEQFSKEPLDGKLVSEVPGIGPKIQIDLAKAEIVMAQDLFNQLKKLEFSEDKFRVWMRLHCSRKARVPVIYKALNEWRIQFGQPEKNVPKTPRRETPLSQPAASVRARRKSSATPAAKRSSSSRLIQITEEKPTSSSNHKLLQYLESFSNIFENIPEEFHSEFRRDILNLADKYEAKTKMQEKTNEPQSSTSH